MHASDEPVVEQPTAPAGSGAFHRSARIATQRRSNSAVRGYSSLSIMFLSTHSAIRTDACGSIHVVTKVARFSREFPSSISSSCTSWYAADGVIGPSGSRCLGGAVFIDPTGSAAPRKNGLTAMSCGVPEPLCRDMRDNLRAWERGTVTVSPQSTLRAFGPSRRPCAGGCGATTPVAEAPRG